MAYRINTTNKDEDLFAVNKHGWKNGISPPTTSTSGTDDFFNHAQEEIARVVESTGYVIPEEESSTDRYDMMLSAMRLNNLPQALQNPAQIDIAGPVAVSSAVGADTVGQDVFRIFLAASNNVYTIDPGERTAQLKAAPAQTVPPELAAYDKGNDLWVFSNASADVWTEPGGLPLATITSETGSFGAGDVFLLFFTGSLFIQAGESGLVSTSPDGVTWTQRTSNLAANIIYGASSGSLHILFDDDNSKVATSSDGITWVAAFPTGINGTTILRQVVWSAARSKFYAMALDTNDSTHHVYSSSDGLAWTSEKAFGTAVTVRINIDQYGTMLISTVGSSNRLFWVSDGRHPWRSFLPDLGNGGSMTVSRSTFAWRHPTDSALLCVSAPLF